MSNTKPHCTVTLHAFVCDAPARAFLKCIKSHNALRGCERCLSVATSVERKVVHLNKVPCEKITNDKFSQLQYPTHQKELTPLTQLEINCVTQFPLDHMHLIFLGATNLILKLWTLTELDHWKATELQQFLLFTGPLVLQDVLSQAHYHHFLSLTIGMSILLDENDARRGHYLDYALNLLEHFVDTSSELYGETIPTYNIHSIKHIADE